MKRTLGKAATDGANVVLEKDDDDDIASLTIETYDAMTGRKDGFVTVDLTLGDRSTLIEWLQEMS